MSQSKKKELTNLNLNQTSPCVGNSNQLRSRRPRQVRDVVCRREGGVLVVEKQRYWDNLYLIVAPLGVLLGCNAIRKHVYLRESQRESERQSEARARERESARYDVQCSFCACVYLNMQLQAPDVEGF